MKRGTWQEALQASLESKRRGEAERGLQASDWSLAVPFSSGDRDR